MCDLRPGHSATGKKEIQLSRDAAIIHKRKARKESKAEEKSKVICIYYARFLAQVISFLLLRRLCVRFTSQASFGSQRRKCSGKECCFQTENVKASKVVIHKQTAARYIFNVATNMLKSKSIHKNTHQILRYLAALSQFFTCCRMHRQVSNVNSFQWLFVWKQTRL